MNLVEGVDDVRGLTLHECYVMVGVACITHVSPTWAQYLKVVGREMKMLLLRWNHDKR